MNNVHDHEININGTVKRLRLIREADGRPYYSVIPEVPEHRTGVLFSQTDCSGGMGQYRWDNPTKYHSGDNIDTSFEGFVRLGFQSTPVFYFEPLTHAIADDGGVFTDETAASINTTADDVHLFPAAPAVNDAYYFGLTTKFSKIAVELSTAGNGGWTLAWEYWDGTEWKAIPDVHDGTLGFIVSVEGPRTIEFTEPEDWAETTVDTQTAYWVRARIATFSSMSARPLARRLWVSASTTNATYGTGFQAIHDSLTLNKTFVTDRTRVWQLFLGYGTMCLVPLFNFGRTCTNITEHNGVVYFPLGSASKYYYTSDGVTFSQTDLADDKADFFLSAPNADYTNTVLWKVANNNELTNTTDGRKVAEGGVAWSSPTYVGDTSQAFTSLTLFNGSIYVGKEDNFYRIMTEGGVEALLTNMGNVYTAYQSPTEYRKNLYNLAGSNRQLMEITSYGTYQLIKFPDPDKNHISEFISWIASDENYLYVLAQNLLEVGQMIYIGQKEQTTGEWAWSPIKKLPVSTERIAISTITSGTWNYLFYSINNQLNFVKLHPYLTSRVYNTEEPGRIFYSYVYGTNPYWDKMLQRIRIETNDCAAGRTVTPQYRKDDQIAWTDLSAPIASDGVQEIKLTAPISGKRFQFRLILATDDPTRSPEVRLFQVIGVEKPEVTRVHECVYEIGQAPDLNPKTIRDFLRTGRDYTGLIKFADLNLGERTSGTAGTDYTNVVMTADSPQEIYIENTKDHIYTLGLRVKWREVNYT